METPFLPSPAPELGSAPMGNSLLVVLERTGNGASWMRAEYHAVRSVHAPQPEQAQRWAETKTSIYWVTGALIGCGVLAGVATLTRYTMVCLLVPLAVLLKVTMRTVRWRVKFGVCFGAFLLVVLPWVVRNIAVADSPFGLARWAVTRTTLAARLR